MKRITSTVVVLLLSILTTHVSAQTKESVSFNHINLKQLRKTVITQLRSDGLIDRKSEKVHLELRTNATILNGKRLSQALRSTYAELLEVFEIGSGSYRTIYLTEECTAVGDFYKGSFTGKVEGKMRLQEIYPSAE